MNPCGCGRNGPCGFRQCGSRRRPGDDRQPRAARDAARARRYVRGRGRSHPGDSDLHLELGHALAGRICVYRENTAAKRPAPAYLDGVRRARLSDHIREFFQPDVQPHVSRFSASSAALRQVVVSAPLALSLFVLAGYGYLFHLPVEVRANWIFRINHPGNRVSLLAGVEIVLFCCAVVPVAILTAPLVLQFLGLAAGLRAALLCLLCSLALMEALLIQTDRIPFTSSYLPGQRPLIVTVVLYIIAVIGYVSLLGTMIAWSAQSIAWTAILALLFGGAAWRARSARIELGDLGQLEFEEIPEPAVQTLSIERD